MCASCIQNSTEAIFTCHPALCTEWLGWVAVLRELWRMSTGPLRMERMQINVEQKSCQKEIKRVRVRMRKKLIEEKKLLCSNYVKLLYILPRNSSGRISENWFTPYFALSGCPSTEFRRSCLSKLAWIVKVKKKIDTLPCQFDHHTPMTDRMA